VSNERSLAAVPLFEGLSSPELKRLATALRPRHYRAGQCIFAAGDPGGSMSLISGGSVKVCLSSTEGKEVLLALLGPGDVFGELALLDGRPRSADVIAKTDCDVLTLAREDLEAFFLEYPRAALNLLGTLAGRLRRSNQLLEDSAFLDIPGRLARALLALAEDYGQQHPAGTGLTAKLTQQELADMIGATRESVNKNLKRFETLGLIRRQGRSLTIVDPEGLRARIY
jgi:CRP/FNR family transcriptional regulator, cyclic AMP receptor protein